MAAGRGEERGRRVTGKFWGEARRPVRSRNRRLRLSFSAVTGPGCSPVPEASRPWRGRRRLWTQLRAARSGGGLWGGRAAEPAGREPAGEWRPRVPGGGARTAGWSPARTLRARSSGPVALSSLLGDLNPFIPTPPLRRREYRPVGEGTRRRHRARADWAAAAAVAGPRNTGSGTAEARSSRFSQPADAQNRCGHVSRVGSGLRPRAPPPPPTPPFAPGRSTCPAGSGRTRRPFGLEPPLLWLQRPCGAAVSDVSRPFRSCTPEKVN